MAGNPHTRKGGLIGLAAAAIAMGKVSIFPLILVSDIELNHLEFHQFGSE